MAIAQNFPKIRPSLNLSFALTKALDPRITFARASAATYYGTDTAKAEENLLLRSQEFDNSYWGKAALTVTANTTVAPDGTTTAEKLVENTATTARFASAAASFVSGAQYTFSCFVKASEREYTRLGFSGSAFESSGRAASFDVLNGVVGVVDSGVTASIVAAGSGWFRCVITATANATASNISIGVFVNIQSIDTSSANFYEGDGTSGIFVWGAQLEQRDAVTNYTPTTTQPITNFVPVLESAAAGEARFDHNPVTGESLGLLIEESRTNLILRSEEFDNAGWTKVRSTITANTIVAPDGTLTGDKLVENTDNNSHLCTQSTALTANAVYTLSVYAKAGGRPRIQVQTALVSNWSAQVATTFDLVTGTVVGGTGIITPVGNGWYRCSITATFGTSNATGGINIITIQDGSVNQVYQGDGFSGIFIWGASLEQAAFPTSYIPTTTAQVTRAADAASMTGANFSSFYNQAEGTFYVEADMYETQFGFFRNLLAINDASGSSVNTVVFTIPSSSSLMRFAVNSAGVTSASLQQSLTLGSAFKAAGAYKTDDFAVSFNAGTPLTDTSGNVPNGVNTLVFGSINHTLGVQSHSSTHYKRFAYYPRRIANAELQGLTTV